MYAPLILTLPPLPPPYKLRLLLPEVAVTADPMSLTVPPVTLNKSIELTVSPRLATAVPRVILLFANCALVIPPAFMLTRPAELTANVVAVNNAIPGSVVFARSRVKVTLLPLELVRIPVDPFKNKVSVSKFIVVLGALPSTLKLNVVLGCDQVVPPSPSLVSTYLSVPLVTGKVNLPLILTFPVPAGDMLISPLSVVEVSVLPVMSILPATIPTAADNLFVVVAYVNREESVNAPPGPTNTTRFSVRSSTLNLFPLVTVTIPVAAAANLRSLTPLLLLL